MHRGKRCVEPEAVFGQMKNNMYYKRFRHFGKDKVRMDFAFFATAFNLKKLCADIVKNEGIWGIYRRIKASYGTINIGIANLHSDYADLVA